MYDTMKSMERLGDIIIHNPAEQAYYSVGPEISVQEALTNAQVFGAVADGLVAQNDQAGVEQFDGDRVERQALVDAGRRQGCAVKLYTYENLVRRLCGSEIVDAVLKDLQQD